MKKLILLLTCLTLCNCQLYIDELNRQKGIVKISEQRRAEIKAKDPVYYKAIQDQKILTGMPEEYLLLSWGEPLNINESCRNNVCFKQYRYYSNYVYVKRGKVTSWRSR